MIDAVIVSYNSSDTLRACVEPLSAIDGVSVTVVDNGSSDGSLETLAGLPVDAFRSGRNGGFGFGCNMGAARGAQPYILFINPDARIDAADLMHMASILDVEPDVALVGPRLLDDDGTLMPSMRRAQRAGAMWAQALFIHRVLPRAKWANEIVQDPAAYERPADPEWVSGACLLVRRDAFEAIGGFDEGFFLYCEDMDLCARLRAEGRKIRFAPGATARHEGGVSAPRSSLYAVLAESRIRYARKHSGRFSAALQRFGIGLNAATHVAVAARRPAHARGHAAAFRATVAAP